MRQLAAIACAIGLAVGGPALAQEPDPIAHYEAYNAAIEAGDYETASTEGEAAWRAAEEVWGESGDTATLAFNLAQMRAATGDRTGAEEPAARALELAALSDAYSEAEARLLHGIAVTYSQPEQAKAELESAMDTLDASGSQLPEMIRGRLDLAMLSIGDADADAVAMAQQAVNESRDAQSPNLALDMAELGKVQYLSGDFGGAMMTLQQALGQWERQPVGRIAAGLADAWAWYTIAGRANEKQNGEGAFGPFDPMFAAGGFVPERRCEIEWVEDDPVNFPAPETEQVTLGASIIMYDFDAAGQPTNIRVVGAAPAQPQYTDFIRQTLAERQAEGIEEGCAEGRFLPVFYEY